MHALALDGEEAGIGVVPRRAVLDLPEPEISERKVRFRRFPQNPPARTSPRSAALRESRARPRERSHTSSAGRNLALELEALPRDLLRSSGRRSSLRSFRSPGPTDCPRRPRDRQSRRASRPWSNRDRERRRKSNAVTETEDPGRDGNSPGRLHGQALAQLAHVRRRSRRHGGMTSARLSHSSRECPSSCCAHGCDTALQGRLLRRAPPRRFEQLAGAMHVSGR